MELQNGGTLQSGIVDFIGKTKPFQIGLLYILYILMIVFKDQISPSIHTQADTFLGRLFIVSSVYGIATYYNWILAIIAVIAYSLLLGLPTSATSGSNEGFFGSSTEGFFGSSTEGFFGSGGETSLQVISTTKKWFVEKVLKENPVAIEEEKVVTSAVQDDSRSSSSGGVQNSSVQ